MMHRLALFAMGMAILLATGTVRAADKPDPTGTWKWSFTVNDMKRDVTLKLKLDGDKLTGAMLGRNNQETAIEEASFKDGEVAFSVTRERNGQKSTTKYKGKLDGDTIKGKSEGMRDGQTQSRDWEAKREKA
ncbi:MAG: hypothetical protein WCJ09_22965 [Planctomycetota bacterium]